MQSTAKRTSEVLQAIIRNGSTEEITLGRFTRMLGDRAFGLAILLFSLPNSLPVPGIPGFSTVTGLPIVFFAVQMIIGRSSIWLPESFARKNFSHDGLCKVLSKCLPAVIWLERFLSPRLLWASSPLAERFLGVFMAVLALIIALPIPLGNFLPGVAMTLLALGLLEKDGLLILGGALFATGTVIFMYAVIVVFFEAVGSGIAMLF